MGTTTTPVYGALVTHTITLASLASSSDLSAGQAGAAIDQIGTDDAIDALVGGTVRLGASLVAAGNVEIWSYASFDGGTNFGVGGGTDAARSPNKSLLRLLISIPTPATNAFNVKWGPYSIAQAWGGQVPSQWGIFITHSTSAALNASGNNVKHYPITWQST